LQDWAGRKQRDPTKRHCTPGLGLSHPAEQRLLDHMAALDVRSVSVNFTDQIVTQMEQTFTAASDRSRSAKFLRRSVYLIVHRKRAMPLSYPALLIRKVP
jgi:hypothetical protein